MFLCDLLPPKQFDQFWIAKDLSLYLKCFKVIFGIIADVLHNLHLNQAVLCQACVSTDCCGHHYGYSTTQSPLTTKPSTVRAFNFTYLRLYSFSFRILTSSCTYTASVEHHKSIHSYDVSLHPSKPINKDRDHSRKRLLLAVWRQMLRYLYTFLFVFDGMFGKTSVRLE